MIISHDAQLSSTTTTRITRYFSVPSMLIFSTRPFFPPIFLISRLPHSVFLTFLTPSSSLRLPHSVFLTPSSSLSLSHFIFLIPFSLYFFLTFRVFSMALHLLTFLAHDAKSLPLSSPFPCLRSFPPDWKKKKLTLKPCTRCNQERSGLSEEVLSKYPARIFTEMSSLPFP